MSNQLSLEERVKNFEEKKQARIDRFLEYSENAEKRADELYRRAHSMADAIPFGQPILVGHHSEKSDRNFRDRIHNTYGKSFEESDKAKYYKEKAFSASSNKAIDSADPLAISKLEEKLKSLEENRELMKKINKEFKKDPTLNNINLSAEMKKEILSNLKYGGHQKPFPPYSFSNMSGQMTQIKQRIEALKRIETIEDFEVNDIKVKIENNYIIVDFPKKPSEETRTKLKSYPAALKWSSYSGAWVRKYTGQSKHYFDKLKEVLAETTY